MQPVLTLGLLALFLFLGGSRDVSRSELVALSVAPRRRPSRGALVGVGLITRPSVPPWKVQMGAEVEGTVKTCCLGRTPWGLVLQLGSLFYSGFQPLSLTSSLCIAPRMFKHHYRVVIGRGEGGECNSVYIR